MSDVRLFTISKSVLEFLYGQLHLSSHRHEECGKIFFFGPESGKPVNINGEWPDSRNPIASGPMDLEVGSDPS